MDVHVSSDDEVWIAEQVSLGRYGDPDQVIGQALHLLKRYEEELAELRGEIQKGLDSGPAEPMGFPALRRKLHAEWDARQKARA